MNIIEYNMKSLSSHHDDCNRKQDPVAVRGAWSVSHLHTCRSISSYNNAGSLWIVCTTGSAILSVWLLLLSKICRQLVLYYCQRSMLVLKVGLDVEAPASDLLLRNWHFGDASRASDNWPGQHFIPREKEKYFHISNTQEIEPSRLRIDLCPPFQPCQTTREYHPTILPVSTRE